MSRIGHRTFRPKPPHHTLFDGKATEAAVSPAHLVFMHGLLGSCRNFTSLATSLAGRDSEQRLLAEAKMGLTTHTELLEPKLSAWEPLRPAAAPRLYTSTAFDWRNHGESSHNPVMNLSGLSDDIVSYLEDYSTRLRFEELQTSRTSQGVECVPDYHAEITVPDAAAASGPLPVVLVAHSMGAMALMDWLWREHVNIWAHRCFLGSDSPLIESNVFSNEHYKVIGAVIIDMAPSQRPDSFNDTIRLIDFLPEVPLDQLHSSQEVEKWLLVNGPDDVFNQQNIFQIRYQLTNIDFTDPANPRWRIGLKEIVGGLHEILWEEGGIASMQQARDALMVANRRRISQRKKIWERPTKFNKFPCYFIFGEDSPYNTPAAHEGVWQHFFQPHVLQLNKADHFMFMRHKTSFMELFRSMCYDAELQSGLIQQQAEKE